MGRRKTGLIILAVLAITGLLVTGTGAVFTGGYYQAGPITAAAYPAYYKNPAGKNKKGFPPRFLLTNATHPGVTQANFP
jgi:hypothetical protein